MRCKEVGCFREVAGVSIVAAGSLHSAVDTFNCRDTIGFNLWEHAAPGTFYKLDASPKAILGPQMSVQGYLCSGEVIHAHHDIYTLVL